MAEEMKEKPIVRVKDVMEKVFVSVTPDIPIRDVFRIFIKHRKHGIVKILHILFQITKTAVINTAKS